MYMTTEQLINLLFSDCDFDEQRYYTTFLRNVHNTLIEGSCWVYVDGDDIHSFMKVGMYWKVNKPKI